MQQRRPSDGKDTDDERSSIGARLQRNQPGIILAIGLTLASAAVLVMRFIG